MLHKIITTKGKKRYLLIWVSLTLFLLPLLIFEFKYKNRFYVSGEGPPIELVGVRFGAGPIILDPKGKQTSLEENPYTFYKDIAQSSDWKYNEQLRDFILKMPEEDNPIEYIGMWIKPSNEMAEFNTDRLLSFDEYSFTGRIEKYWGPYIQFRTILAAKVQSNFLWFNRFDDYDFADINIKYFQTPLPEPIAIFTGPFKKNRPVKDNLGSGETLTIHKTSIVNDILQTRFSSSLRLSNSFESIYIAHLKSGKRVYACSSCIFVGVITSDIEKITLTPSQYTRIFHNVRISDPHKQQRTQSPWKDELAELGKMPYDNLQNATSSQFSNMVLAMEIPEFSYRLAVLRVLEESGISPVKFSSEEQTKIRSILMKWASGPPTVDRLKAAEVGLQNHWPEFINTAINIISLTIDQPIWTWSEFANGQVPELTMAKQAKSNLLQALTDMNQYMSLSQLEEVKNLVPQLSPDDALLSLKLFHKRSNAPEQNIRYSIETLIEFAQQPEARLWWSALSDPEVQSTIQNDGLVTSEIQLRLDMINKDTSN